MSNQLEIALRENKLLKNYDISRFDLTGVKGNLLSVKEGEIIYRSDEKVDQLFLIISGEVNLIMRDESKEIKSMMKSANDYFGDEHIFSEIPAESTAVALSDCYLITLTKNEVNTLLEQQNGEQETSPEVQVPEPEEEQQKDGNETEVVDTPEHEEEKYDSQEEISSENQIKELDQPNLDEKDSVEKIQTQELEELKIDEPKPEEQKNLEKPAPVPEEPIVDEDMEDLKEFLADEKSLSEYEVEEYKRTAKLIDTPWTYDPKENKSKIEEVKKNDELEKELESFSVDRTHDITNSNDLEDSKEKSEDKQEISENEDSDISELENGKNEEVSKPEEETEKVDLQEFVELTEQLSFIENEQKRLLVKSQILEQTLLLVNASIYLEDTVKNILTAFNNLAPCEKVTLYMVDKESQREWNRISGFEESQLRLTVDDSFAKEVLKLKKVLNIKDTQTGENGNYNYRTTESSKSVIGIPFLDAEENVIAVILLINSSEGHFSDEDEAMLAVLAKHSTQAILNGEKAGQLIKSENLISVKKLTYFLDEEFRKKVYLTKSYLEGIANSDRDDDDAKVIKTAYSSAKEMHYSLNRIFAFGDERPHLYLTRQNLNSVIQSFLNDNKSLFSEYEAKILFDSGIDVDVKIDTNEFSFVLKAILKNACEALQENKQIKIESNRDGQTININIIDKGSGIPDSAFPLIFDPFYSYNKENSSGLGLSISQKIIEDHNGKLLAKSDPETGTKFTISLPIAASY